MSDNKSYCENCQEDTPSNHGRCVKCGTTKLPSREK